MRIPITVKPLGNKKLYIKYSNGIEGIIGIEKLLKREEYDRISDNFDISKVYIEPKSKDIILDKNIRLCKNAVYEILQLKKQMERIGLVLNE